MGTLVFGMMQSLDGYVDGVPGGPHMDMPGPRLHRHFNDTVRASAGIVYGRRMYEVMRYWDVDQPEWDAVARDFAAAWRPVPKWVLSSSLDAVGPNATLVRGDAAAFVRTLKSQLKGEIGVAGPTLAASLSALGLIDEYQLHFRPFVLGGGKPFFLGGGAVPSLRFVRAESIGEDAVKLTYVVDR